MQGVFKISSNRLKILHRVVANNKRKHSILKGNIKNVSQCLWW